MPLSQVGGLFVEAYQQKVGSSSFKKERKNFINFLELLAVLLSLKCFSDSLSSQSILIRTENTTVVAFILIRVRFPKLSTLARVVGGCLHPTFNRLRILQIICPDYYQGILNSNLIRTNQRLIYLRHIATSNVKSSWFPDPGSSLADAFTQKSPTSYIIS